MQSCVKFIFTFNLQQSRYAITQLLMKLLKLTIVAERRGKLSQLPNNFINYDFYNSILLIEFAKAV